MDKRRALILALIHLRRKRREVSVKNRRYWVDPLLRVRYVEGAFYTLFDKLTQDDKKFFNYFRMSTATFDYLLSRLSENISRQDTKMRYCTPPRFIFDITIFILFASFIPYAWSCLHSFNQINDFETAPFSCHLCSQYVPTWQPISTKTVAMCGQWAKSHLFLLAFMFRNVIESCDFWSPIVMSLRTPHAVPAFLSHRSSLKAFHLRLCKFGTCDIAAVYRTRQTAPQPHSVQMLLRVADGQRLD